MGEKISFGENKEVRSKALNIYENFNKVTMVGWLGAAVLVPAIAPVAIGMAAIDGAQAFVINKVNKKPENKFMAEQRAPQTVVFDAKKARKPIFDLAA